jgi:hypothetical protein
MTNGCRVDALMTKEKKKKDGRVAYCSSGGGACCVEEGIDQVELNWKAAQW